MLYLNIQITLVILLVTPLCFLAAYLVAKFSQQTFRKQQETVGEISSFVSEIIGNQKIVKAFGYEENSLSQFDEMNARLFVHGKNAQFASAMVNPSTRFVDHLSYLLVGVCGGFVAVSGGASVGMVSSFLIYSSQYAKPFNEISGMMAQIQTAFAAISRIREVLDADPEASDAPDALELKDAKGTVEFNHVAFSYQKGKPLIKDLSFTANPGETIAIVGPTGAGKTTLVNLLMRFYETNSGLIIIDGHPIRGITRDSLRSSFGMVLQDTWLFAGSIRDNIAYAKPHATDEEITAAAKAAHAHSFIKRLPEGYNTMLEQDGGNLSQGQKQLLTIARAMLADPAMLILDEATSSIDTLTEIRIQKAFLALMKGRTSFVIAHRLSTIVSANLILVLDHGDIVEAGTHEELLEKRGFYWELYHSQYAR